MKNILKDISDSSSKAFYEVFSKRTIKESYEEEHVFFKTSYDEGDSKVTILTYTQIFKFGVRLSKENEKLERKKKELKGYIKVLERINNAIGNGNEIRSK